MSSFSSKNVADQTISYVQSAIEDGGKLPFKLNEEDKDLLIETAKQHVGALNDNNQAFLNYLSSECHGELFKKNKIKINIESGQIFIDNWTTSESLYDSLRAQQDLTKKILIVEVPSTMILIIMLRKLLQT